MKTKLTKVSATWSRTIQVHQYEPERVDIAAELTIEGDVDVTVATSGLLDKLRVAGEAHVTVRLNALDALEQAARPQQPAGPLAPDPFV